MDPFFLTLSPDAQSRARVVEKGQETPQGQHIHPEGCLGAPEAPRTLSPKGGGYRE